MEKLSKYSSLDAQFLNTPGTNPFRRSVAMPSLEKCLELTDSDPVAAAHLVQKATAQAGSTMRAVLYLTVSVAYRYAQRLHDDNDLWEEFRSDPFWKDHSRLHPRGKLRYALMYCLGSHQGSIAERARDYATALEIYWRKQVPASRIPGFLHADGGLAGIKKTEQEPAPFEKLPMKRQAESGDGNEPVRKFSLALGKIVWASFEEADVGTRFVFRCVKTGISSALVEEVRLNPSHNAPTFSQQRALP